MDTTLVIGLGATGRSVIRHLDGRERLLAIDTRRTPPFLNAVRQEHPQVEIVEPEDWPRALAVADRVVASPGVPLHHCLVRGAVAAGALLTSDIALFLEAAGDTPVIGVTGTNGKSTVVSLVGELLGAAGWRAGVGGNLGTPALDMLKGDHDVYALELSSFQLERLDRPGLAVAAVLNVSADHGDRYPDLDAYAASKRRIFGGAAKAVFNARDAHTRPNDDCWRDRTPGDAIALHGDPRWRLEEEAVIADGAAIPTSALALAGRHNHGNVLAAAAIAHQAGVDVRRQHRVLTSFRGLPHRTQLVATVDGVRYVNDSKATNVGACVAALEGLGDSQRNIVLIAGGEGKGACFADLIPAARRHLSRAVLIGADAPRIERALEGQTPTVRASDMADAVRLAGATRGQIVLLSPACASFDMYANFEVRGEAFRAAVGQLAAKDPG